MIIIVLICLIHRTCDDQTLFYAGSTASVHTARLVCLLFIFTLRLSKNTSNTDTHTLRLNVLNNGERLSFHQHIDRLQMFVFAVEWTQFLKHTQQKRKGEMEFVGIIKHPPKMDLADINYPPKWRPTWAPPTYAKYFRSRCENQRNVSGLNALCRHIERVSGDACRLTILWKW